MIEENTPIPIKIVVMTVSSLFVVAVIAVIFIIGAVRTSQTITSTNSKAAEASGQSPLIEIVNGKIADRRFTESDLPEWNTPNSPAILREENTDHLFFCAAGEKTSSGNVVNYVNYTYSRDNAKTWSYPEIKLSIEGDDSASCHPSPLYFQNNYYLFYIGSYEDSTALYVARSSQIAGEYLTYTERGSWVKDPPDARPILLDAAHPSLIVENTRISLWFTNSVGERYLITSSTPTQWTERPQQIDLVKSPPVDIKFDEATQKYIAVTILDGGFSISYSDNKVEWSAFSSLPFSTALPPYAKNLRAASDRDGKLDLADGLLLGLSSPSNYNTFEEYWSLFGVAISLTAEN